jgi:anti-sigma B factor antagonist
MDPALLPVTTDNPILVGVFDRFSWIRCEGKGSFLTSPTMKAFGEARIVSGERCLVVDLGGCTGMDSTFMGTLAGMAARLSAKDGGRLQVADASERNRRSLEDLGLDFLLDIDPPQAPWRGQIHRIRELLTPATPAGATDVERAVHVLEAHRTLSDQSEENARKFAGVVGLLESELAEKRASD